MATFDERFILPTQLPELEDNRLFKDFQVTPGTKIGNILTGNNGEERYQTWPERMVRSGLALPADVYEGREAIIDPTTGHTAQPVIERTQDLAGLAGMSSIPLAEKGALGAIGGKFYSTLENTIQGSKVQKATPEQWTSYLKNQPGVKPEELEFSLQGLGDKVLTKEQLAQHVADNGIKFNEVVKGKLDWDKLSSTDKDQMAIKYNDKTGKIPNDTELKNWYESNAKNDTKYSSYQLPGGENYRELLMTVPSIHPKQKSFDLIRDEFAKKYGEEWSFDKLAPEDKKLYKDAQSEYFNPNTSNQYKSSHWDEPNVLAHIRMNDREVPGVGKTLHVEEIQSDWHQAGRKSGYREGAKDKIPFDDWWKQTHINDFENLTPAMQERARQQYEREGQNVANNDAKVPNAPFKKTWDELALKRVLSEAATKGYDAVSWTPGEAQAARYDLSKHYDNITATKRQDGSYNISGTQKGHKTSNALADRVAEDKLADTVGKELAEKIIKDNKEGLKGAIEYSGVDLKVGGEGMKAFYDTMLPAKANALIKKMGGKVEYHDLPMSYDPKKPPKSLDEITDVNQKIPIIKITPQMRETIANKGFPLYSSGVPTFTPVDKSPFDDKKYKLVPVDYNPWER